MSEPRASLGYIAPVLRVSDFERSLAFYREQLGFDLDFCYESFYASVRRDGCYIHLSCSPPTPRDQSAFERAEQLDVCAIVADAEALAEELAEAGVAFSVPPRRMPYGVEFYVRDPDGYILGFIEPASDGADAPEESPE